MRNSDPAFPVLYRQTNGADGVTVRLFVAAQIAATLAHKLLPHGVVQNLADRRVQAKHIAIDALDIAERLIELEAEREEYEREQRRAGE